MRFNRFRKKIINRIFGYQKKFFYFFWIKILLYISRRNFMKLIEAVCNNDKASVMRIIAKGINPNLTEDDDGVTALHHAVQRNLMDIVQILLLAGADPAAETCEGLTPLEVARMNQRDDMIKLLMGFLSQHSD